MKKMFAVLVVVVALTLVIASVTVAGGPARATGSANSLGGSDRQFSFTAIQTGSGFQAKGQGQLVSRESGHRVHFVINCLKVVTNEATISGYIKHTNNPAYAAGDPVWFKVRDNGEGHNVDEATPLAIWPEAPGSDCTVDLGLPWYDVGAGNIQVR